jgi:hypothetical protein
MLQEQNPLETTLALNVEKKDTSHKNAGTGAASTSLTLTKEKKPHTKGPTLRKAM